MKFIKYIVIHSREETNKKIDDQCRTIYKEKLQVMNIIAERLEKEKRKYELIEDNSSILRDLNTYLPKLMNYMWEQPEVVVSVIKKADITELKKNVAPYFANNFYENILSPYYIEDNLMYVLTLLLQDEINNLSTINQEDIRTCSRRSGRSGSRPSCRRCRTARS